MKLRAPFVLAALAFSLAVTPAQATFPGENGKIVFVGNESGTWQLYTINPDGRDLLQLTHLAPTDFDAWSPFFSPDGHHITFCYGTGSSVGNNSTNIYVINSDGTGLKQLTTDDVSCAPHWSPNGNEILYERVNTLTRVAQIVKMPADGGGETIALTTEFWGAFGNSYTPDGRRIAFDSDQGGFVTASWIMNIDGTNQRRVTAAPLEACLLDVAPDGRHLLLALHCNTNLPTTISTIDTDGRDLTELQGGSSVPGSYSPDGKEIVFITFNSEHTADLRTMNIDGSDIKKVASAVGSCPQDVNCVQPSWGPKPKQK